MPVEQPSVRSAQQPLVGPDGKPTHVFYQFLKQQEAHIKALEARIAALEAP